MDVSGNPVKRPATPIPPLVSGIKTLDDLFALMGKNETLEDFKDMTFVATGVESKVEDEIEPPEPMSIEMDAMPVQTRFSGLTRFKDETLPLHHQTACNSPRRTSSAQGERSQ